MQGVDIISKLEVVKNNVLRLNELLTDAAGMCETVAACIEALVHAAHTPNVKGCGDHRSYKVVGTCIGTLPLSKDAVTTAPIYICLLYTSPSPRDS